MSTTNLHPTVVFPNYSLSTSAATKASIADAVDTTGILDADSFTVNGVTITAVGGLGGVGADEIQFIRGSSAIARNKIRLAINGTEDADVSYGSNLDSAEGVDGVKAINGTASNQISLEAEDAGLNSLTLANVVNTPVTAAGLTGATGTDASGTINIPLSDLTIGTNQLTTAEAAVVGGDYRKLAYHVIRKFQEYLDNQESIVSIAVSGGTGYDAADTISIASGGGSGATATFTQTTGVPNTPAVTAGGTGYTSDPTILVNTTTGTGAVFTVTRSANTPQHFDVTRGFMVEGSNGLITRAYEASFTYSGDNLDIAPE